MSIASIRIFFALLSGYAGYQVGSVLGVPSDLWGWIGSMVGVGIAGAVVALEFSMRRISVRGLSATVFGLLLGLLLARLLSASLDVVPMDETIKAGLRLAILLIFSYLGMVMAMRGKDEFNVIIPYVKFARQDQRGDLIVLDTSVIIDGRIADIIVTRFVEGSFVVPRFVLTELQHIADSAEPLKRNRGRRGLDVLNKIRKNPNVSVKVHDEVFPDVPDVDAKLVKLAQVLDAKVLTNDYNLNKIAELQGVKVLNINDLANSLRPVVLPGEQMEVRLVREGKEYNQAVAYMGDGTMVVVENGRSMVGQTVRATVTSVLQTSAGRMVFAKLEGSSRNAAPMSPAPQPAAQTQTQAS